MRFAATLSGPSAGCVAMDGGECAGFFPIWPVPLADGASPVAGGQPIDVMTSPQYRGQGLFPRLARQAVALAADRGLEVLYGAPNAAALPGYRHRLGWAEPCTITTHVRPLTFRGALPAGGVLSAAAALLPAPRIAKQYEIDNPDRLPARSRH